MRSTRAHVRTLTDIDPAMRHGQGCQCLAPARATTPPLRAAHPPARLAARGDRDYPLCRAAARPRAAQQRARPERAHCAPVHPSVLDAGLRRRAALARGPSEMASAVLAADFDHHFGESSLADRACAPRAACCASLHVGALDLRRGGAGLGHLRSRPACVALRGRRRGETPRTPTSHRVSSLVVTLHDTRARAP